MDESELLTHRLTSVSLVRAVAVNTFHHHGRLITDLHDAEMKVAELIGWAVERGEDQGRDYTESVTALVTDLCHLAYCFAVAGDSDATRPGWYDETQREMILGNDD